MQVLQYLEILNFIANKFFISKFLQDLFILSPSSHNSQWKIDNFFLRIKSLYLIVWAFCQTNF